MYPSHTFLMRKAHTAEVDSILELFSSHTTFHMELSISHMAISRVVEKRDLFTIHL